MLYIFFVGIVGEMEDGGEDGKEYYLWTHKKLEIGYNGNQVRIYVHTAS